MNADPGKPGGNQAEEDNEGYVPSNTGSKPIYRDEKINEGASSSLSGHVYPNPPVFCIIPSPAITGLAAPGTTLVSPCSNTGDIMSQNPVILRAKLCLSIIVSVEPVNV